MENTILIIDDHRDTVDALAALFLQSGWMVQRALTGEDGVAAARRHLPSILASDLAMPGMSGFDVAEAMRTEFGDACPTMIALTGWTDEAVTQQALTAGFSVVLKKPIDFQLLLSVARMGQLTQLPRREAPTANEH